MRVGVLIFPLLRVTAIPSNTEVSTTKALILFLDPRFSHYTSISLRNIANKVGGKTPYVFLDRQQILGFKQLRSHVNLLEFCFFQASTDALSWHGLVPNCPLRKIHHPESCGVQPNAPSLLGDSRRQGGLPSCQGWGKPVVNRCCQSIG